MMQKGAIITVVDSGVETPESTALQHVFSEQTQKTIGTRKRWSLTSREKIQ